MMVIKKVTPMFTKIITTCNKYDDYQKKGSLVDVHKAAGSIKEYQTVIAVGTNPAGVKVGDLVLINPIRYAVMKHKDSSMKNGVIGDNPVVEYNFPVIEIDGKDCLKLDTADIELIINEYEEIEEEKTPEQRAFEAGIYTPSGIIYS